MMDLSQGKKPSDLAFPDRDSVFEVSLNGEQIPNEDIFVVQSYDDKYSSGEVSTLLANSNLKKRYEKVHKSIGEAKKALDRNLKEGRSL